MGVSVVDLSQYFQKRFPLADGDFAEVVSDSDMGGQIASLKAMEPDNFPFEVE